MKKLPVFILIILSFSLNAQNRARSYWIDKNKVTIKKTALNIGISMAAVALEMTGDALYDMGKRDGNLNQMKWGHTLQATGYVVPFATIPIVMKDSKNKLLKDIVISVGTYSIIRFATADLWYNLTYGNAPLDVGSTSAYDQFMSKMPPDGRAFYKGVGFAFGVVLNLNHW